MAYASDKEVVPVEPGQSMGPNFDPGQLSRSEFLRLRRSPGPIGPVFTRISPAEEPSDPQKKGLSCTFAIAGSGRPSKYGSGQAPTLILNNINVFKEGGKR